jgi:hypothetical protein
MLRSIPEFVSSIRDMSENGRTLAARRSQMEYGTAASGHRSGA